MSPIISSILHAFAPFSTVFFGGLGYPNFVQIHAHIHRVRKTGERERKRKKKEREKREEKERKVITISLFRQLSQEVRITSKKTKRRRQERGQHRFYISVVFMTFPGCGPSWLSPPAFDRQAKRETGIDTHLDTF